MSLMLFASWVASMVVFAKWRGRVLTRRDGHPDLLNDGLTSLFVSGTALIVLVLILALR